MEFSDMTDAEREDQARTTAKLIRADTAQMYTWTAITVVAFAIGGPVAAIIAVFFWTAISA